MSRGRRIETWSRRWPRLNFARSFCSTSLPPRGGRMALHQVLGNDSIDLFLGIRLEPQLDLFQRPAPLNDHEDRAGRSCIREHLLELARGGPLEIDAVAADESIVFLHSRALGGAVGDDALHD